MPVWRFEKYFHSKVRIECVNRFLIYAKMQSSKCKYSRMIMNESKFWCIHLSNLSRLFHFWKWKQILLREGSIWACGWNQGTAGLDVKERRRGWRSIFRAQSKDLKCGNCLCVDDICTIWITFKVPALLLFSMQSKGLLVTRKPILYVDDAVQSGLSRSNRRPRYMNDCDRLKIQHKKGRLNIIAVISLRKWLSLLFRQGL